MKEIIKQFALANEVGEPRPLKVGIINDSYILPALHEGEKSYFLQRINHHIFTNIDGLQRNIAVVTDHIREKLAEAGADNIENRVLRLVKTCDGQLYYRTPEGDVWRVYVLIENGRSEERVTPESAYLAGKAFGDFQNQLADLPFDALCESIPNFHNIEFRLMQLHDAIREDKAGRVDGCRDIINFLAHREEEMCLAERLFREGKLPKHINHCDTKVNNMMFDAEGKPLCIVDLDTVMPGFVCSDFGDFMRTAANKGLEDDPVLDNVKVDLHVFAAYTKGYLEKATFLTDLERSLLPYGCRLLSYMQTVRFFTDYLNGDTYYKIQYPEHNLVRTRAQLRLLEEQERMKPAMEAIVSALSEGKNVALCGETIKIDQVNWPDAYPEKPEVTVNVNRDKEAILLHYHVKGNDLRAMVTADHGEVWTDSCCEWFVRIPGEAHYRNYEVNCIGAMTASSRKSRTEDVTLLSTEGMQRIRRIAPLADTLHAPCELAGEHEWDVELRIPFAQLLHMTDMEWQEAGKPVPPVVECNFYKCGDLTAHPHFLSWAPIATADPDFHCPQYFGLLVL